VGVSGALQNLACFILCSVLYLDGTKLRFGFSQRCGGGFKSDVTMCRWVSHSRTFGVTRCFYVEGFLWLLTLEDDSHHDFSEMSGATHPITSQKTWLLRCTRFVFRSSWVYISTPDQPSWQDFCHFPSSSMKTTGWYKKIHHNCFISQIFYSFINHCVAWCYTGSLNKLRHSWFEWAQSCQMWWQMQK